MKLFLLLILALPQIVFSQTESSLPNFCQSKKVKDMKACEEWRKGNHRLINDEIIQSKFQATFPDRKADGQAKKEGIARSPELEAYYKAYIAKVEKCAGENLTPEEKKSCEEFKSATAPPRISRSGLEGPYYKEEQLEDCYFSTSTEILCPDGKIYEFTGKVNNALRIKEVLEKETPAKARTIEVNQQ